MGINVSMSGSGEFGEIAPGWSVSEYATPVVIGDSAGGTGNVNFSARATDETLFVVNNNITTTEADLGSISGVVTSVSQTGINASISHNTKLASFDSNLTIPALGAGGVVPALDITSQLIKRDILLNASSGNFYSLAGHSQGFDSKGEKITPKEWFGEIPIQIVFGGDGTGDEWMRYRGNVGSIYASDFFTSSNNIWARKVQGDSFDDDTKVTSSRVFFKALLGTESIAFIASSEMYVDNDFEGTYALIFSINKSTAQATFDMEYVAGGFTNYITHSESLATLDLDSEVAVFVELKRPASYGSHKFSFSICNSNNYANSVSHTIEYVASRPDGGGWRIEALGTPTIASGIRALYRAEDAGLPSSGWVESDRNYIINPSFETNTSNWSTINGYNLSAVTGGVIGTKCLSISPTAGDSAPVTYQRINVSYSYFQKFNNASAYFKSEAGKTIYGRIYVEQYDSTDTLIYSNSQSSSYAISTNGEWQRVYVPFNILPGTTYILVKIVGNSAPSSGSMFVDGVMLTRSNSEWILPTYFDGDSVDTLEYQYSYDVDGTSIKSVSAAALNREYENPSSYTSSLITLGSPVAAVESNAWQYLQDACSAYSQELSLVDNNIVVRELGQTYTSIDNVVGAPSISPKIILGGRSVEVSYVNSVNVINGEVYSARKDDNRILTVKANEIVTTKVSLNGSPTIIKQPTRVSVIPADGIMSVGTYAISSTTTMIPPNLWEYHGGKIRISVNKDDPSVLDVTLFGPDTSGNIFGEDTAMYPGPYKLAHIADGTDFAALSIAGSGVVYDEKTLKLQTGADPEKVSQDVAKTINNPFVDTLQRAYDRGIWLSNAASGPVVTLSGSIPVSTLNKFGLTAGSLITYRDSRYRITDVSIGNLSVNFNATRHVTVQDFDMLWAGRTVDKHDLMWQGYDTSDQVIAPLRYIGDDESVLMFLDTDVNPYYDFTGEPEISVFPDSDMNPYYELGGNLEGEDEVRLDTDENPYDDGEGYGS